MVNPCRFKSGPSHHFLYALGRIFLLCGNNAASYALGRIFLIDHFFAIDTDIVISIYLFVLQSDKLYIPCVLKIRRDLSGRVKHRL